MKYLEDKALVEKFFSRVKKTKTCWNWISLNGNECSLNCGMIGIPNQKPITAYRFSYEYHKGKVPKVLEIDHLCRNRRCVNPDHLEAVTHKENIQRIPRYNSDKIREKEDVEWNKTVDYFKKHFAESQSIYKLSKEIGFCYRTMRKIIKEGKTTRFNQLKLKSWIQKEMNKKKIVKNDSERNRSLQEIIKSFYN